jgi:PTH1 family peptidyl-tRNA hydrolase
VKLIAGLGNPGSRYAESRHNVGYAVVDELARRWAADTSRHDRRFEALVGQGRRSGESILLVKPTTYMNLSGQSVAAAWRYYKLSLPDVLIVYDDLDLAVGQLRVRASGSSGGHKGMEDVIRHLGSDEVSRIRVGIGKVHRDATTEYVLSRFRADERLLIAEAISTSADAAECWLARGIVATMNQFNRRRDGESSARPPAGPSPPEGEQP